MLDSLFQAKLEGMAEDFWNAATAIKILVLLVAYPLWGPILKVMWSELQDALAPEGGVYGKREKRRVANRPPGMDPFVSIPLASHRQRLGGAVPRPIEPPSNSSGSRGTISSAGRTASGRSQGGRATAGGRRATQTSQRRRGF